MHNICGESATLVTLIASQQAKLIFAQGEAAAGLIFEVVLFSAQLFLHGWALWFLVKISHSHSFVF
jgi:hypothetical protein